MFLPSRPRVRVVALLALTAAALALPSCAAPSASPPTANAPDAPSSASAPATTDVQEAQRPTPRLAISHDQGIWVLDATTLQPVGEATTTGFVRLNPAGDGRHLFVTTGGAFTALDLGSWTDQHGDHGHSYTTAPRLTDVTFPAKEPGHVVHHGNRTALFADGSGRVELIDPHDLADGRPTATSWQAPRPHHGVAVPLPGGGMIVSEGDHEKRTGVAVLDQAQRVVTRTKECPGVHGEAVVDGAVVFGCENGLVVYRDGRLTKVDSPSAYGRIGNQAGSPLSSVVLGDYKSDPDADLERPERVSLVDTRSGRLRLVDLGTSYSFRSLGRGPRGDAVVLGTDGKLHVIDLARGKVTVRLDVVAPWSEPDDWQSPRPALFTIGSTAYVTEPATRQLHRVNLRERRVENSTTLPGTPNEISGTDG